MHSRGDKSTYKFFEMNTYHNVQLTCNKFFKIINNTQLMCNNSKSSTLSTYTHVYQYQTTHTLLKEALLKEAFSIYTYIIEGGATQGGVFNLKIKQHTILLTYNNNTQVVNNHKSSLIHDEPLLPQRYQTRWEDRRHENAKHKCVSNENSEALMETRT